MLYWKVGNWEFFALGLHDHGQGMAQTGKSVADYYELEQKYNRLNKYNKYRQKHITLNK